MALTHAFDLNLNLTKMEIIFFPESGGHIDFEIQSKTEVISTSQHGTSVPLWQGELAYVPDKRCNCGCDRPATSFSEEDCADVSVKPIYEKTNSQSYADKYRCWTCVQVYDKDQVLADCPDGFVPVQATIENGVYSVQERFV